MTVAPSPPRRALCSARTVPYCSAAWKLRRSPGSLSAPRGRPIIDAIDDESRDPFLSFALQLLAVLSRRERDNAGPKRREIRHGRLARRGIQAFMPEPGAFGFVVRVVSEILEIERLKLVSVRCGLSMNSASRMNIPAAAAGAPLGNAPFDPVVNALLVVAIDRPLEVRRLR
jgi:hypothetical protein